MGVNHVAIILDGNRRYGEAAGIGRFKGHEKGAETISKLLKWGSNLKAADKEKYFPKILTLYVFSMQNFNRTHKEKQLLFSLFEKAFKEIINSKEVESLQLQVNFLGRVHLLPQGLQKLIKQAASKTSHYSQYKLNFCIAYGGREEIVDAVNAIIAEGRTSPVTETDFEAYLYSRDDVDLVIRTSGEHRTSNYLIWQANYAEWFFPAQTWPEFTPELFMKIIDEFFEKRERRFGQ